ncbi:cell division protein ZapD [Methylophaga sp. OBS4]|uniref:cell division protein ZapD n=1 Tax=Methylophaga sp. OBS4 TaxID=2991935 RepID=UPI002251EB02|nr:cell division protein ZapD [Methylophaga sp. OBS4]MCX4188413.1 cell division protein ZapD [Methylophaga sp. OBS4]
MSEEYIIFEQPLNERIRTFLRLEFLFMRVDNALTGHSEMHHRDALDAMLNMLSVFERSDLKQELMKEIERLIANLSALENSPGVDQQALETLLSNLDQNLDALHIKKTSIGQRLRENEFLYSIRQRSSIPGGTCDFDLPAYHFWLQHTQTEQRAQQLQQWLAEFVSVRNAVEMSLRLIRSSVGFKEEVAKEGFFQRSLDANQPYQLIRVEIPGKANYFPEVSGGKHRFTVRFMLFDIQQRPQQTFDEIPFRLSCCAM